MEEKVSAERLSVRQLTVASAVAALSPAAAYAGRVPWVWMLFWSAAGVLAACLIFKWVRSCGVPKMGAPLKALYAVWAVVLSTRILGDAAERLEQTSGGSPRFWLTAIFVIPLLLIGWGRTSPFFRMTEILWPIMMAVLALVLVLGIGRIELRYVLTDAGDWKGAALGAVELFVPALYVIPYIYNVDTGEASGGVGRLLVLSGAAAAMCLLTAGILGAAGETVPNAFFVAAGVVGKTARMEGLLSAIWLTADLSFVCLLCRSWGGCRWPAVAAALSAAGNLFGFARDFSAEFYAFGSLILPVLTVLSAGMQRNFVVKKGRKNHI